jgi:hypothetical protein
MTREQIAEMVKALGPEVARELIDAAARSAPGRVGTDRATREGSVYASVENFGAFTKSVIALGRRTGAAELIDAAKRFGNADVRKAVQLSKFDSAGVFVPIQQSGEVIEFLRPDAALLKLGVRTQAFKGELHMGTQTGTSVFSSCR